MKKTQTAPNIDRIDEAIERLDRAVERLRPKDVNAHQVCPPGMEGQSGDFDGEMSAIQKMIEEKFTEILKLIDDIKCRETKKRCRKYRHPLQVLIYAVPATGIRCSRFG